MASGLGHERFLHIFEENQNPRDFRKKGRNEDLGRWAPPGVPSPTSAERGMTKKTPTKPALEERQARAGTIGFAACLGANIRLSNWGSLVPFTGVRLLPTVPKPVFHTSREGGPDGANGAQWIPNGAELEHNGARLGQMTSKRVPQ